MARFSEIKENEYILFNYLDAADILASNQIEIKYTEMWVLSITHLTVTSILNCQVSPNACHDLELKLLSGAEL